MGVLGPVENGENGVDSPEARNGENLIKLD